VSDIAAGNITTPQVPVAAFARQPMHCCDMPLVASKHADRHEVWSVPASGRPQRSSHRLWHRSVEQPTVAWHAGVAYATETSQGCSARA
jgi:hypothetical protein